MVLNQPTEQIADKSEPALKLPAVLGELEVVDAVQRIDLGQLAEPGSLMTFCLPHA